MQKYYIEALVIKVKLERCIFIWCQNNFGK